MTNQSYDLATPMSALFLAEQQARVIAAAAVSETGDENPAADPTCIATLLTDLADRIAAAHGQLDALALRAAA